MRSSLSWVRRLTAAFAAWAIAFTAHGTIVPQMTMDDLMDSSALVFKGTAQSIDVKAGVGREARTAVAFNIEATYLGAANYGSTFTSAGGYIAAPESFLLIDSSPTFEAGHCYIVFARSAPYRISPYTNWHHSVFEEAVVNGTSYATFLDGSCVAAIDANGFHRGGLIRIPVEGIQMGDSSQFMSTVVLSDPPTQNQMLAELPGCMTWAATIAAIQDWVIQTGNQGVVRAYSTTPEGNMMTDVDGPEDLTAPDAAPAAEEFEGADGLPP